MGRVPIEHLESASRGLAIDVPVLRQGRGQVRPLQVRCGVCRLRDARGQRHGPGIATSGSDKWSAPLGWELRGGEAGSWVRPPQGQIKGLSLGDASGGPGSGYGAGVCPGPSLRRVR
ncbi:hypothetical protein NDU88_000730 [Pleurodeles waltl]|uniref:Uncharacterized protein n=1 Tax=Pleurodeles waltl TaxID=8319 RepID=A0AAV7LYX4_PLEWA|nr:hypothetical protein NDU88_000730 [Pleurodeles waltl]